METIIAAIIAAIAGLTAPPAAAPEPTPAPAVHRLAEDPEPVVEDGEPEPAEDEDPVEEWTDVKSSCADDNTCPEGFTSDSPLVQNAGDAAAQEPELEIPPPGLDAPE